MEKIRVGLIGCGYWGKNHLRTLGEREDVDLAYVCDSALPKAKIPERTKFTRNISDILDDKSVGGVVISTPASTHYELALASLNSGKGTLVEKPLAMSAGEAEKLCLAADDAGVLLMVGEIFRFNPAIQYIKDAIKAGTLGKLRYIESRRVGLGPVRSDASVLWDLATHDVYISNLIMGKMPDSASYQGASHNGKFDDVACLNLKYSNPNVISTIYVNWEHPIKERKLIVGGTKRAIMFDDIEPSEKVRVYERGMDYQPKGSDFAEFQASTRDGDIIIPKLRLCQPLEAELGHFLQCLTSETDRRCCLSKGADGLQTVRVLEAAEESRKRGGLEVRIK